jgi:hypothetical protein
MGGWNQTLVGPNSPAAASRDLHRTPHSSFKRRFGNATKRPQPLAEAPSTARSPLADGIQDGFHVEHGGSVDRFEIADGKGVLLDAHDNDRVQPDRVGAIR